MVDACDEWEWECRGISDEDCAYCAVKGYRVVEDF